MQSNKRNSGPALILGTIALIISAISLGTCVSFFIRYLKIMGSFRAYNIIILVTAILAFFGTLFKYIGLLIKREYSIVMAVLSFVFGLINGVLFLGQFGQRGFDPGILQFQYSTKVFLCGALVNFLFFVYYLADTIAASHNQKTPGFLVFLPLIVQILFSVNMCLNKHLEILLTRVKDIEFMLYLPLSFVIPAVSMLFLCPAILIKQKKDEKNI